MNKPPLFQSIARTYYLSGVGYRDFTGPLRKSWYRRSFANALVEEFMGVLYPGVLMNTGYCTCSHDH